MEQKKEIEVFGTLTKMEPVSTIDEKVAPGSLIFEAMEPFPGYYHETPFGTKPLYLYLALEENYPLEEIIRTSQKIEKELKSSFDAGKGFLKIYNEKYNVLRIRHINDYNLIKSLQEAYSKNGIRYLQKSKKIAHDEALIKIVKFFYLESLGDGIWLDNKEDFHAYIELPEKLDWNEFKELTLRVKYNWEGSSFDAATGAFYHEGRLHEFVRIYSTKIDTLYLKDLKKMYLEKMK